MEKVRSTLQKRDAKGAIRHGAEWLVLWSDPDSFKTKEEKRSDAALHRASRLNERALVAAARSVSGNPRLEIVCSQGPASAMAARRGEIDSYALMQRFHSSQIHEEAAAGLQPVTRKLFDLCEHLRCEALGALRFPGARENIIALHRQRLETSNLVNAHLASLIPLAEGLRMTLRDFLFDTPEPSIESAGFRMWDQWIRSRYGTDMERLREAQIDQKSYAPQALTFIHRLLRELGWAAGKERQLPLTDSGRTARDESNETEAGIPKQLTEVEEGGVFEPGGNLFLDNESQAPMAMPAPNDSAGTPYSIFTAAHDAVISAAELVRLNDINRAALREARASVDRRRADFRRDFGRLVAKLQRRLLARQVRQWSFDLEEGLIDASRLDRIVVDPRFASPYKQEEESRFRNSVVSILIDNSGSMRGQPVEIACLASDMISAALERCGVTSEILGFTTRAWKGGESAKDWVLAGRPANPGRLNDVLHIVYKSATEPVRRSRPFISAMMQTSILKENIDGEALLWASRRLLNRPEGRKALIVISDGAPADEATLKYNADSAILDRHLRQTIAWLEKSGLIELSAIGVRHAVGSYYRNVIQVDRVEDLGVSLVATIDRLLRS